MERADVEKRVAEHMDPSGAALLLDTLTQYKGDSPGALVALEAMRNDPSRPTNANFKEGLEELERVYKSTLALGVPAKAIQINLSIARGLDYYTGTVYETFLDDHPGLGSICSGGRYADLASHYTKSKLPGVGISIGATRLFSQLLELGLIKSEVKTTAQVFICNVDEPMSLDYLQMANQLRAQGIRTEVYGAADKLGKQLKYADRAGVPVVVIYGGRERDAGTVKLKILRENREVDAPVADLVARVRELLGAHA
jgi:histidyl-tRNA synthetase